jgi:vacuolar-type H+-ATPase subunit E/Vma4
MSNPGFDILKEAFKKFASKYDGADMAGKGLRIAAAGGKAVVDSTLQEFPKTFINQVAKDIYSLLTSQEVADGISASVRAFDEEKVKEIVDGLVSGLKDPETSLKIAKQLKSLLDKTGGIDLGSQIEGILDMAGLEMGQKMILQAVLGQIVPIIEEMKNASEEDVAAKLAELADMIPSDMIAAQVANLTREVTPERVSKEANDIVGKLPSPQAIADIVHGVGAEASKQLDLLAKASSAADAKTLLQEFIQNAGEIVTNTVEKDKAAKKTFKKDGKSFDL